LKTNSLHKFAHIENKNLTLGPAIFKVMLKEKRAYEIFKGNIGKKFKGLNKKAQFQKLMRKTLD